MTPEEIDEKMEIYDGLFKEASKFDHLCEAKAGACARGVPTCCVVQPGSRKENCDQLDPVHGCRIKTLMCKIWFCGVVRRKNPELVEHIQRWGKKTLELPGILFFQSREDYKLSLERSKFNS